MLGMQSDDRSNWQLKARFESDVHKISLHCSTTIFQLLLFSCKAGFPWLVHVHMINTCHLWISATL